MYKREPTYLLPFVPHGEDVLTWLPSGLKETGNWLRVTHSVDQAPQIPGAAVIVRSHQIVSQCRIR